MRRNGRNAGRRNNGKALKMGGWQAVLCWLVLVTLNSHDRTACSGAIAGGLWQSKQGIKYEWRDLCNV